MRKRRAVTKKGCSIGIGSTLITGLLICCGFALLINLGSPEQPVADTANSISDSRQQAAEELPVEPAAPEPTTPPENTATATAIPTATPIVPPAGQAATVANLRSEPRIADDTVLGVMCPGDQLHYTNMQQIGDTIWYAVTVAAIGEDCDSNRIAADTAGWASSTVLSEPSYAVAEYAAAAGFQLPTAIPPTAVPTTAPAPQPAQSQNCDPSYPDICIPRGSPDLDCGEIPHRNFRVVGSDPHRFDGDDDGIGCEQ